MSKENWFDWSAYKPGKKSGSGSYGDAMKKSARNVASGKKTQGRSGKKFPVSVQKVAAALAKKFTTRGTLRKGVPANATADQMLSGGSR